MATSVTSYTWGNAGSDPLTVTSNTGTPATAPTAAQALNFQRLIATIIATADSDTTVTLTHNWGLSAAQQAMLWPSVNPLTGPGQLSLWYASSVTANTVVMTKSTASGSGAVAAQAQVQLDKPNTISL